MTIVRNITAFLFLVTISMALRAQSPNAIFLSEGKIEFEKKVNQYAGMEDDNSWNELQKKTMSKFKLSYFDLTFNHGRTLFKPGREVQDNGPGWWSEMPANENVVYSELDSAKSISQKKLFEELFLVRDSIRTIRWKLTDETRTIAGFSCRRANAIILDSVYVVAFYTDEILTTGGPESFSGLPGMILGIALPHQHTTWFATKVQAVAVPESQIAAPAKGKKVDSKALKSTVQELIKNWATNKRSNEFVLFTML